ncbi:MAG TPA: DUF2905 domain-containing protein [Dissulfurispiraceae bacterium]|nr:DUF2905 domain-containing protein [Dissulfurispiraceae bacterium]
MEQFGKTLLILGLVLAAVGGLLMVSGKLPWLGKLPGDIVIERKNFTVFFPLATSIVLSILLSLIFWFFGRK